MNRFLLICILPLAVSCSVSRNYDPNKKFPKQKLQEDYLLLQNILEEKHPSLYWYTSKDSMDKNFQRGFDVITDSMTELQFGWRVLAPLLSSIHCGHTSFAMSKNWNRFIKDKTIPSFPLYLKVWRDSMMVLANLNKDDTVIKRGDFVTAINGIKNKDLIHTLFRFMPADGFANNVNYIRLSASFPYFHRNVYGLYQKYFVNFKDSTGKPSMALLPYFLPPRDTLTTKKLKPRKPAGKEKLRQIRRLDYDSNMAVLTINKFTGGRLRSFLRRSFKELRKNNTKNLVIDLRANGGGDINKSALLTRYIRDSKFKVADSAYAISQKFGPFNHFISHSFFNNIGLLFVTKKGSDGNYHFGFWENHVFKPKRRNHFDGKVFILINGLTFSASALFTNAVKGQDNVWVVGEESGGGWYGNSGILIPEITLPHTRLRVRLPFFRLVQYNHVPVKGTGIIPDIYIGPNWRDILNRRDTKMEEIKSIVTDSLE